MSFQIPCQVPLHELHVHADRSLPRMAWTYDRCSLAVHIGACASNNVYFTSSTTCICATFRVSSASPYSRTFTRDSLTIDPADAVSTPACVKKEVASPSPTTTSCSSAASRTLAVLQKAKEHMQKRMAASAACPAKAGPPVSPPKASSIPAVGVMAGSGWLVPPPPARTKQEPPSTPVPDRQQALPAAPPPGQGIPTAACTALVLKKEPPVPAACKTSAPAKSPPPRCARSPKRSGCRSRRCGSPRQQEGQNGFPTTETS